MEERERERGRKERERDDENWTIEFAAAWVYLSSM